MEKPDGRKSPSSSESRGLLYLWKVLAVADGGRSDLWRSRGDGIGGLEEGVGVLVGGIEKLAR